MFRCSFLNSALDRVSGKRHCPAALFSETASVPMGQEVGWGQGPVWTGVENINSLSLTEVRTPRHPGSSESLYSLRYRGSNPEDGGGIFIRNVDNQYEATWFCNNREDHNKIFTAVKTSSVTSFPYSLRKSSSSNNNNNGLCAAVACSVLTHSRNQYDEKWMWRSLLVYLRRDVVVRMWARVGRRDQGPICAIK